MRKYLLLGMMPFWLLIAIWYPSLQPIGGTDEVQNKNTCLKVGETARLFFKDNAKDTAMYLSEYVVRFYGRE